MTNLNISAAHSANPSSPVKRGAPQPSGPNDILGFLDSLFNTELDAASNALLTDAASANFVGQNALIASKNTLSGRNSSQDDANAALDPNLSNAPVMDINLTDAMQLAAAQGLLPTNLPIQSNIQNTSNGIQSIEGNPQNTDQRSTAVTMVGVNNQNLLNVLTSSMSPVTTPSSFSNSLVSAGSGLVPTAKNTLLDPNVQGGIMSHEGVNAATSKASSDQNQSLINQIVQAPQASNKDAQLQAVVQRVDPKVKSDQSQVPLSSLSDAIAKFSDAKVLSVNTSIDSQTVSLAVGLTKNENLAILSEKGSLNNSSVTASSAKALNLVGDTKKEDSNKDLEDDSLNSAPGAATGFMVNPSFTNHASPVTNLKLAAADTSLSSGPLSGAIMTAAKSGGGRISLEVHPDNAGPVRLDLQIDQTGQARLIVHGASDSTQARLQQGGDQLRQEFAQMGLNLTLDMGQNSANNSSNPSSNDPSNLFNNNAAQQIDTNDKNSNRIRDIQVSSNTVNQVKGDTSGINLVA